MRKIDKYEFDGDWEFNLKLPSLSKIQSDYWFRHHRNNDFQNLLNEGYVPFSIWGERTYDPDPTESQTNAIKYLIKNEKEVVKSLFKIFVEEINPKHVEWCGEDDWIPKLESENDLGRLVKINSIGIIATEKENQSFVQINFEYKGDEEHGLAMILHKQSLIGFSGIGDMGFECIYKDLGLDESKVFEEMLEQRHIGENEVHKPLSKYGKFKPWQLNATSDYFGKLLREKENEKLIQEIESNNWNINLRFGRLGKNLVDKAAYSNNVEMLKYLIDRDGDFSESMEQCINKGFYHPESIKYLVSRGATIDSHGYWGKTPLCYALENYIRAIVRVEEYRNKDEKRFESTLKEYETNKDKIKFYLELGADPNNLDKEGNNYVDIVSKSWAEHVIIKHKIHEKVKNLINKN